MARLAAAIAAGLVLVASHVGAEAPGMNVADPFGNPRSDDLPPSPPKAMNNTAQVITDGAPLRDMDAAAALIHSVGSEVGSGTGWASTFVAAGRTMGLMCMLVMFAAAAVTVIKKASSRRGSARDVMEPGTCAVELRSSEAAAEAADAMAWRDRLHKMRAAKDKFNEIRAAKKAARSGAGASSNCPEPAEEPAPTISA